MKLKEIIRKSLNLSNPSLLANTDLEETADDWFFVVGKKIPYQRLGESEEKAYEIRNSTYPLHPNELCYAWELISRTEAKSKPKECQFKSWHLEEFEVACIATSNFEFTEDVVIPCPKCRSEDYAARHREMLDEFHLKKCVEIFYFAAHYPWLIVWIKVNPLSPIDFVKTAVPEIAKKLSPVEKVQKEWREKFEEFKAIHFNDRQTQKEISAELKNLRKQELDLIKLEK